MSETLTARARVPEQFALKVYLAGPGVFHPQAVEYGKSLQDACAAFGLLGLWPLDSCIEANGKPADPVRAANQIRRSNEAMILRCSAVVADISPFRAPHMHSGTAYEIGFAKAAGKPIFLYSNDNRPLLTRMTSKGAAFYRRSRIVDANGWTIENFGLAENLMVGTAASRVFPSIGEALEACREAIGVRA